MEIIPIKDWGIASSPLIIAGPCSAETEKQTLESCAGAAAAGANVLRAGIWKPRTGPHSFQGIGEEGMPWLVQAGKDAGLPTSTEVGTAEHVEIALKYGIDILWIGAKTVVDPYAVENIAAALKGVDVPVMVKNPATPTMSLWTGAFKRLHNQGVRKMAAIHRGFATPYAAPFRHEPLWDMVAEFMRLMPGVEMINDPSHICGRRDLLLPIARKAKSYGHHGWMIETHTTPDEAWSDAAQQVTPEGLKTLLGKLFAETNVPQGKTKEEVEALWYDLNRLDGDLAELLQQRAEVSKELAKYKQEAGADLMYEDWDASLENRISSWGNQGIPQGLTRRIMDLIRNYDLGLQNEVLKES